LRWAWVAASFCHPSIADSNSRSHHRSNLARTGNSRGTPDQMRPAGEAVGVEFTHLLGAGGPDAAAAGGQAAFELPDAAPGGIDFVVAVAAFVVKRGQADCVELGQGGK
jgi:hypothetical protein